jgi:hypothetical protein
MDKLQTRPKGDRPVSLLASPATSSTRAASYKALVLSRMQIRMQFTTRHTRSKLNSCDRSIVPRLTLYESFLQYTHPESRTLSHDGELEYGLEQTA